MSEFNVIAYIEPVNEKNLATVKKLLEKYDGHLVKGEANGDKVKVLFKNYGKKPLPTLEGYKITGLKKGTLKKHEKHTLDDIKLLFKDACFDKYTLENVKEYVDLSVTIPTVAGLLVLYTALKVAEWAC